MKDHLFANDGKRYQDSKTGQNYRFDWKRFYRAFRKAVREAGDGQEGIDEVEARLAKAAQVSEKTVHSHLWHHGSPLASYPSNTDIIRSYGAVLAGDEEAFLLPSKAAVRRSSTPPERLRQWRERERAWLEYEIASMKDIYEDDALRIILEVFSALWDILSLYEISDGYNYRPDTGSLEGAEEYFETLLDDLRERWGIGRWGSISEMLRSSIGFYIADKLGYIIYETEVFVKSYSVPGVSRRWREINPHLNYYDPVFDLLEELPPKEFDAFRDFCSYHPTQRDIPLRRLYFSALEGREDGADMAYFQEELLDTLVRVFKKDFVW